MQDLVAHVGEHVGDIAILDPAIRVAVGAALDQIKELVGQERMDNLKRIAAKALHLNRERGIESEKPPLSVSVPLLEAARDESRDELVELWAALLATATNPAKRSIYRRQFSDIVKQLEPIDTLVLPLLNTNSEMPPNRSAWVAQKLGRSEDEVVISMANLDHLGLLMPTNSKISNPRLHPVLSPLGRQFMIAVTP